MGNSSDYMKVSAGLGEEVLADANKEKMISRLTKEVEKMLQDGDTAEHIARMCVNFVYREKDGKKKNLKSGER